MREPEKAGNIAIAVGVSMAFGKVLRLLRQYCDGSRSENDDVSYGAKAAAWLCEAAGIVWRRILLILGK